MNQRNREAITPVPAGFRVVIDPDIKRLDDVTLFGGSPARALRLSAAGLEAWDELHDGVVVSATAGLLARRLTDAGLAHPRLPAPVTTPDVTVVVPVRDRPAALARCLASIGRAHPVVVVDDGSSGPRAVAEVAARHSATLVSRADNGGPGAARNTGLERVTSELVALLDSDCVATPGWTEQLAAHFADPLVAAVASRVVAVPSASSAGRYAASAGSLDMGECEGRVAPGARVAYVPTAALVERRTALLHLAGEGDVFDEDLRYGEDVDLIWRLHETGSRVRHDPAVATHGPRPGCRRGRVDRHTGLVVLTRAGLGQPGRSRADRSQGHDPVRPGSPHPPTMAGRIRQGPPHPRSDRAEHSRTWPAGTHVLRCTRGVDAQSAANLGRCALVGRTVLPRMLNTAITITTGEPDATEIGHVRLGKGPSEKVLATGTSLAAYFTGRRVRRRGARKRIFPGREHLAGHPVLYKALRRYRGCPRRLGAIVAAALVLLHQKHGRTT